MQDEGPHHPRQAVSFHLVQARGVVRPVDDVHTVRAGQDNKRAKGLRALIIREHRAEAPEEDPAKSDHERPPPLLRTNPEQGRQQAPEEVSDRDLTLSDDERQHREADKESHGIDGEENARRDCCPPPSLAEAFDLW